MIIVTAIYLLLILFSIRIKSSPFNNQLCLEGYKPENTNAVKGLLTIGILLSHLPRISYNELPFTSVATIGSIGVGAFFFFSGYGLAYVAKRRPDSFNGFIPKKLLRIGLPFVFLFVLSFIFKLFKNQTIDFLLTFVKGYPYSNTWYVFAIILFYIFFYFCFKSCDLNNKKSIIVRIFLLCVCIAGYTIFTAFILKWGDWWHKTPICFVIGVSLGFFKDFFEKVIRKSYILTLCSCVFFSFFSYFLPAINNRIQIFPINYIWPVNEALMGLSFSLLLMIILYKVSFIKPITSFLGKYSYEIYLWHGFIIEILNSFFQSKLDNLILQEFYSIIVIACTLFSAVLFNKFSKCIIKK